MLDELPPHFPNIKINLTTVNPRLVYFIGYFYGDGGLKDINKTLIRHGRREYKMIISDEFYCQIKKIQFLFLNLFGVEPPIRTERILKGERTYYLNPTNKRIYKILTEIFGLPEGPKTPTLKIPKTIFWLSPALRRWFVRGLFDADGDTRAVEKGFTSQSRVKLRMKAPKLISQVKGLLEEDFEVSVNGPYSDKYTDSQYIQVERFSDIRSLSKQKLFYHPIKRWRLKKSAHNLISSHRARNHNLKNLLWPITFRVEG